MAELSLVKDQVFHLSKEAAPQLSVFVEKGAVHVVFQLNDGNTQHTRLVSGDKKAWDDLAAVEHLQFTGQSDLNVLHYQTNF